jgi:hypothetical protein
MSKEHMTRAEWNAANKGAPTVVNTGFDVGVRTTPRVKPDGARIEPRYRNNGFTRRAGPGESKAGERFAVRYSAGTLKRANDWGANFLKAQAGLKIASDVRAKVHAAIDEGLEVDPALSDLCERIFAAAEAAMKQVISNYADIAQTAQTEANAQAGAPTDGDEMPAHNPGPVGYVRGEGPDTDTAGRPVQYEGESQDAAIAKKRAVIDAAIAEAGNQNALRRVWGLPAVNLKDDEAYKAVLNAGK